MKSSGFSHIRAQPSPSTPLPILGEGWPKVGVRAFLSFNLTARRELRMLKAAANRDIAQLGSASDWGSEGRRFKSGYPDQTR